MLQALLVSTSGRESQTLYSYQSMEYILVLFCLLLVSSPQLDVVEFHSHLFTEQLLKHFVSG